jgi:hypothetical protein
MRRASPGRPSKLHWASLVADVKRGKRVGSTVYVNVLDLAGDLRAIVNQARTSLDLAPGSFRVVKLHSDRPTFTLLDYPGLGVEAFPTLRASYLVNLVAGSSALRTYGVDNPPVLHRQELLLPARHPRRAKLVKLTADAERDGLLDNPTCAIPARRCDSIVRLKSWGKRLASKGLRVEGLRLTRER